MVWLLLLSLHAYVLVTVIATPHHMHIHCTHLGTRALYQINKLKDQVNYLLVYWALHKIDLKYLSKDILALSLKLILKMHSRVSHKYYKQKEKFWQWSLDSSNLSKFSPGKHLCQTVSGQSLKYNVYSKQYSYGWYKLTLDLVAS